MPYNAATDAAVPAASRPKIRPWEPKELGRFLDLIAEHRLGALIELDALAGLRRGELLGLRWSDVDLDAGRLLVRQQVVRISRPVERIEPCAQCGAKHRGIMFSRPKTTSGEDRVVDLDESSVEVLRAHRRVQDAERRRGGVPRSRSRPTPTGTCSAGSARRRPAGPRDWCPVSAVSITDPDNETAGSRLREPAGERSAPPGTRTPNPRIKSPLLCQLS